jgi:hypothetical protein
VTERTALSRSADYSTVGLVLGGDSGGFFDVYTAATGKVASGGLNSFISSSSLNVDHHRALRQRRPGPEAWAPDLTA